MTEAVPLPTCPMAETCKGMMAKPLSGIALFVPGIVLIALGVLIVIEPQILVWIIAVVFILMGGLLLMMARFIRNIGAQYGTKHEASP